jgi:hypothetical protein
MSKTEFRFEDLENIRLMATREKEVLKAKAKNYNNDCKMSDEKRLQKAQEVQEEINIISKIADKATIKIGEMLAENENG